MPIEELQGVKLHYKERGAGRPMVFVHGLSCDLTTLEPQVEHFASTHRTIALDLPGHGESELPADAAALTINGFASHTALLCERLGIENAVVVGHSIGGGAALTLAATRPDLVSALVFLDSAIALPEIAAPALEETARAVTGDDFQETWRHITDEMQFLPSSDPALRARIVDKMASIPQRVVVTALENFANFAVAESVELLRRTSAPMIYIASSQRWADRDRLAEARPDAWYAAVACSGHFLQLEVPQQVNAMIERFLAVAANGQ
jgi:pimeloyl-ACP methyl ester carboxylesterase